MTKEIELAAEAEYPEKPKPNVAMYNLIQRSCQQAFIAGAQWMATRDRWVSVSERLPENDDWVLGCVSKFGKTEKPFCNYILYYENNKWFYKDYDKEVEDSIDFQIVTHWMPLPELPSPPQSKNTK